MTFPCQCWCVKILWQHFSLFLCLTLSLVSLFFFPPQINTFVNLMEYRLKYGRCSVFYLSEMLLSMLRGIKFALLVCCGQPLKKMHQNHHNIALNGRNGAQISGYWGSCPWKWENKIHAVITAVCTLWTCVSSLKLITVDWLCNLAFSCLIQHKVVYTNKTMKYF